MQPPNHFTFWRTAATGLFIGLTSGVLAFVVLGQRQANLAATGSLFGSSEPGAAVDSRLLGRWILVYSESPERRGEVVFSTDRQSFEKYAVRNRTTALRTPLPNQFVFQAGANGQPQLMSVLNLTNGTKLLITDNEGGLSFALHYDPSQPEVLAPLTPTHKPAFTLSRPGTTPPQPAPVVEPVHLRVADNLRSFVGGARNYMMDTGATQASYLDLAGTGTSNYVYPLKPIAGENYDSLVINKSSTQISVDVPGTGPVTYNF